MAFLLKLWENTRASYWFVPGLMMIGALVLAVISESLDRHPVFLPSFLPAQLLTADPGATRSLLSVVAQSVITVTGVMFSMTVVAVSFASANFGPRLIGNFMRDRGTQFSLGTLIATFVYALATLRSVQNAGDDVAGFVPVLSVSLALLLTLCSVVVMIYFIHHVPEMINLENLCHNLGRRLRDDLIRLRGKEAGEDSRAAPGDTWLEDAEEEAAYPILLRDGGYVQTVDFGRLRRLAQDHDLYIDIRATTGAFTHPHRPALMVWAPEPPSRKLREALHGCFAVGSGKTETQNVLFLAQQLVEIIARALSPSVNDPYTARSCLNWLHAGLNEIAAGPGARVSRASGRVNHQAVTFTGLLDIAHGDSRQYIRGDDMVRAHALSLLRELAARLPPGPRLDAVQAEIDALGDEPRP